MKKIPHGIWALGALMLLHFTADMVGGILPGILPVLRNKFSMTLASGVLFLALRSLSSNFCQIAVGSLRKNSNRPFFIYIGLLLLMFIGLLGFLPTNTPLFLLMLFAVIFGCGTAVVHPEGLRGAMAVQDVNNTTATALFMTMGFFGFSCGPLIGALLVDTVWGLKSLFFVAIFLFLVILIIFAAGVKLLTDKKDKEEKANNANAERLWNFPTLFFIAFLMNSGSTILQALLPTFLHDAKGFNLKLGGLAALLFGLGSAAGSIFSGVLSKKIRSSKLVMFNLFAGVLLLGVYFSFCNYLWSLVILVFAGFTVSSSLPLLVVMARNVPDKLVIGLKMGIMVGGTWGCAGLVLLILSSCIKTIGLKNAMWLVCIFYATSFLLAAVSALIIYCRRKGVTDEYR